ncbi:MAG: C40 family peptidase, partial [Pseudonocardia sp.]|nr:C40 family peptidase [Pseudonocardia sp.]
MRRAEFTTDAPDVRAAAAIRTALAQIGLPYVWGGNGPTNGDAGFDCSGLTTFSYSSAGVPLPRTAHTQYNTGPHVPDGAPLQPGDLVFYGTTARVHHVGMYLGAGRMVNAPTFGKPVQVAFYRYSGDDYLGATRPAASPGSLTSGFLPYVDPATLPAVPPSAPEQVFTAPTAPMVALPQPGDPAPPEQVSAAQSVQEAAAVSVEAAAVRPAAVAGTTTSTSA